MGARRAISPAGLEFVNECLGFVDECLGFVNDGLGFVGEGFAVVGAPPQEAVLAAAGVEGAHTCYGRCMRCIHHMR